jgi:hypothetical protein
VTVSIVERKQKLMAMTEHASSPEGKQKLMAMTEHASSLDARAQSQFQTMALPLWLMGNTSIIVLLSACPKTNMRPL